MNSKQHGPQSKCIAIAGRYCDNNGQILHLGDTHRILEAKDIIYNPILVHRLQWRGDSLDNILLEFAEDQRLLYESHLHELMNQYKIKSEGELGTGCILKYHKLHKRRRHDVSEEVRRHFRNIRKQFRSEVFTAVHHLVHNNSSFFDSELDHDDEIYHVPEDALKLIEDAATGKSSNVVGGETIRRARGLSSKLAASSPFIVLVTYT